LIAYEKIIPTSAEQRKAESDRRALQRAKFNRRTAPVEKWVNRLGYHSVVSNYTGGNTVSRLSGSSINKKIRKDEKFAILSNGRTEFHALEFIKRMPKRDVVPAWVCPGLYSEDQVKQIRNANNDLAKQRDNKTFDNVLSQRSKGIVRSRFTAFYRAAGGRKTFCTLTFINDVTDSNAIGILNKFLTALRDKFKNLQYIWVAERQEKTTNRIHFHMVLNVFLPIVKINALWVLQQYNSGITHPNYSKEEIENFIDQGIVQQKLSPVDVRRIKNISQLSGYLTKYITKGNNKGAFGCAVWHCSREVSKLYLRTIVGWEVVQLAKSSENARFNRSTGEYFGEPTYTAGRVGKKGGFLYMVYHLNQPARFLCYLREMEQLNKWILSGAASVEDIIEYLNRPFDEDSFFCSN
jgi:hypothetical protein